MSHAPLPSLTTDNTARERPLPVMLTPLRRCGSNAIRLRLAVNPDFYSPHPFHVIDLMPLVPLYGDLADDEAYLQLVIDLVGLVNVGVERWEGVGIDPIAVFEAVADKTPRSVHAITWEVLIQAGEQHGARVVMDKACESVEFAEDHLAVEPQTRFVNVVRDPRSQVSSINQAIILDFDTTLNAQRWVRAHDIALALAERHPDRVLTIRYEDLVVTPEPVLRSVCEFIGLEYLPEMLDVGRSAATSAGRSALWENNSKPLTPAFIDKYTRHLSTEEIEIIETLAADHMRRYGYEFRTAASAVIDDAALARAARENTSAKRRAWEKLRSSNHRDYQMRRFRRWYLEALRQRLVGIGAPVPGPPG